MFIWRCGELEFREEVGNVNLGAFSSSRGFRRPWGGIITSRELITDRKRKVQGLSPMHSQEQVSMREQQRDWCQNSEVLLHCFLESWVVSRKAQCQADSFYDVLILGVDELHEDVIMGGSLPWSSSSQWPSIEAPPASARTELFHSLGCFLSVPSYFCKNAIGFRGPVFHIRLHIFLSFRFVFGDCLDFIPNHQPALQLCSSIAFFLWQSLRFPYIFFGLPCRGDSSLEVNLGYGNRHGWL